MYLRGKSPHAQIILTAVSVGLCLIGKTTATRLDEKPLTRNK